MTFQLCPHKQNPKACLACYHQRRAAPPAPRVTRWGEPAAVAAPPLLQRNVDRAIAGHQALPPSNAAPRGEQAVEPRPETSGKIGVSDGAATLAAPKPKEQAQRDPGAPPLRDAYHAPAPEPEGDRLWDPPPLRDRRDLIDVQQRHPDAERARR